MISSKPGAAETTEYICQPKRAGRGDHASWASGIRICAARNTTKKQAAMTIEGAVRRWFTIWLLHDHAVCRFSAQSAEKRHTIEKKIPLCRRLKYADRVSPIITGAAALPAADRGQPPANHRAAAPGRAPAGTASAHTAHDRSRTDLDNRPAAQR